MIGRNTETKRAPGPRSSRQRDLRGFVIPNGISRHLTHRWYHPLTAEVLFPGRWAEPNCIPPSSLRMYILVAKDRFWSETSWVGIPAPPLTSYMAWGKTHCHSVPLFPPLKNGYNSNTYRIEPAVRMSASQCLQAPLRVSGSGHGLGAHFPQL